MFEVKRVHLNITVKGRVQGVGFRFAAKNMAVSLGIKGSVRNLHNGDVIIEAEGTELQLKHFLDWCARGPVYANVDEVTTEEGVLKDYRYFDITH